MESFTSYSTIFSISHKAVQDLLKIPVIIEEKVDGSQISFGKDHNDQLFLRSRGMVMNIDAPEKMFNKAAETIKNIKDDLVPGWTYRGEYLAKPQHNTLAYSRVPKGNIIGFDIAQGEEDYVQHESRKLMFNDIGLESVPVIYEGNIDSLDQLQGLLDRESVLGGCKIEGIVIKAASRNLFGPDKKPIIAKLVSAEFKEVHAKEWGAANPKSGDILMTLGTSYCTEARWMKAIQHLREIGKLEESPRDIGILIKEIIEDVHSDSAEEIRQKLFKWAWPSISRMVTRGFPEWYKEKLTKENFKECGFFTKLDTTLSLTKSLSDGGEDINGQDLTNIMLEKGDSIKINFTN